MCVVGSKLTVVTQRRGWNVTMDTLLKTFAQIAVVIKTYNQNMPFCFLSLFYGLIFCSLFHNRVTRIERQDI